MLVESRHYVSIEVDGFWDTISGAECPQSEKWMFRGGIFETRILRLEGVILRQHLRYTSFIFCAWSSRVYVVILRLMKCIR